MINKLTGIIGGGAFGTAFGAIGYYLFINKPIQVGGRRGQLFMSAQDWLIETLGMSGSGVLLMGVGLIGGCYAIYTALTDTDEE